MLVSYAVHLTMMILARSLTPQVRMKMKQGMNQKMKQEATPSQEQCRNILTKTKFKISYFKILTICLHIHYAYLD